jgi:hypothetical protein
MEQSFDSPLDLASAATAAATGTAVGGAPIRISQLDAWTTPGSAAASDFCFFCLAVPADDAVRPA